MTWRQLAWMVEGRQRNEWEQLSTLIADLRNGRRQKRTDKFWRPSEINPFDVLESRKRTKDLPKPRMRDLRAMFVAK